MLRAPLHAAVLLTTLALPACGRAGGREGAAPTGGPDGPPTWSAVREETYPGGTLLDVRASAPCRVRVEVRGTVAHRDAAGERVLAAGETARLWWHVRGDAPISARDIVTQEDAQAGRTEARVVAFSFGFTDGPAQRRLIVVGCRPGAGRVTPAVSVVPPQVPQPLTFDGEQELAAIALVDGAAPDLVLVGGDGGARIKGAPPPGPQDRVQVLRLVLHVERMVP